MNHQFGADQRLLYLVTGFTRSALHACEIIRVTTLVVQASVQSVHPPEMIGPRGQRRPYALRILLKDIL